MAKEQRGRRDVFTSAQNRTLRRALHDLKADLKAKDLFSQEKIGQAIGVCQQRAAALLKSGNFSYGPATALVRRLGFAGVDDFFAAKGVALGSDEIAHRQAG